MFARSNQLTSRFGQFSPRGRRNFLRGDRKNAYSKSPSSKNRRAKKQTKNTHATKDKTPEEKERTIFIGNLPNKLTEVELAAYFGKFGPITQVDIPQAGNGRTRNRCFAFVTYATLETVFAVCKMEHQISDVNETKVLSVEQMGSRKKTNKNVKKPTSPKLATATGLVFSPPRFDTNYLFKKNCDGWSGDLHAELLNTTAEKEMLIL